MKTDKWRVLIVDDEPELHVLTTTVLKDFMFEGKSLEFVSAHNELEISEALESDQDYAIIITDIIREEIDSGFKLIARIRSDSRFDNTYLIIRSGSLGLLSMRQAATDYDVDYINEKANFSTSIFFSVFTIGIRTYRKRLNWNS